MKYPTKWLSPYTLWFHGTDYLPLTGVEWCSFFSKHGAHADRYISQPGRDPHIPARWIVPARLKKRTPFLDVRSDRRLELVGAQWYKDLLEPYLPANGDRFDVNYAEAFCAARDELFPGFAGVYRGRFGIIVARPDEVMTYGRPRRAKKPKAHNQLFGH